MVTKVCKLLHVIDTKRRDQNKTKIKYCSSAVTKGFAIPMQLNLVKSTPVYALFKGFSVIQDIGNIPVIQVHLLLFINSFFTIGLALQRRMNKGSLKELSFFPNSYSFSNTVIYVSLPTPMPHHSG